MELPHLTLYLRRLAAPLPREGGLRAQFAAPRIQLWLRGGGWLALAAAQVLLAPMYYLSDLPGPYDLAQQLPVLAANMAQYLPLAAAMASLANEPGLPTGRLARQTEDPLWYGNLLDSMQAVLGVGLAGLLSILPSLLGVLVFFAVQHWLDLQRWDVSSSMAVSSWVGFWRASFPYMMRLPQLALAMATLCIALRRSFFAPYVPLAMAASAALVASSGFSWVGQDLWAGEPQLPAWARALSLVGFCALLLFGLNRLLRRVSAAGDDLRGAVAALGAMCVLPCLLSVTSLGQAWEPLGTADNGLALPVAVLHASYSSYLPDLDPLGFSLNPVEPDFTDPAVREMAPAALFELERHSRLKPELDFYGRRIPLWPGLAAGVLQYLLSLVFWLWTAVQCLDAARGQQRSAAISLKQLAARQ